MSSLSRRKLMAGMAYSAIGIPLLPAAVARTAPSAGEDNPFIELIRQADSATAFFGLDTHQPLSRIGTSWQSKSMRVRVEPNENNVPIYISSPEMRPTHIRLRWSATVAASALVMGDDWERSYGNLHWSYLIPERVMPWYFLTLGKKTLHGYGVKTGAGAFCFWQLDPRGASLWLDVSNGGAGVELGNRELHAATIVSRRGGINEDTFAAARVFCSKLCDAPRSTLPMVYGSNDWYYAYGRNSAEQILRDADLIASVTPSPGERPFTVIDDGWKDQTKFPDMGKLAEGIRERNVRPGLWIRPLRAPESTPPHLLLPKERFANPAPHVLSFDPTLPEARAEVLMRVKQAVSWGYELIKHDYTTFELLGRWGFEMGAQPTLPGWNFYDRTKTTAEIVRELYTNIRAAAGTRVVLIGCNTIGHLGAGIFDIQRTGDDTSGREWERTRRMGINTLAYRLCQHRTFFLIDADCVPITGETPWRYNRQWLDLVARSGTALFVSPAPGAVGNQQRDALREAFQIAQSADSGARPLDWETNTTPSHWKFTGARADTVQKKYDWYLPSGVWPYDV